MGRGQLEAAWVPHGLVSVFRPGELAAVLAALGPGQLRAVREDVWRVRLLAP